ncbi:MAG TPA: hypothetical protein VMG82_01355 [Candidatus Sulfotelmatobacter sp.]|nr:hypothetical protein [Candidatus Sulfotelmatobacter sp.]
MNAPSGRYFNAAMFGFAITALFVSYQLVTDSQPVIQRDSAFMLAFVVLCPPSLLSLTVEPEARTNVFYLLWTLIALMNAGLYAGAHFLLARRLQRHD